MCVPFICTVQSLGWSTHLFLKAYHIINNYTKKAILTNKLYLAGDTRTRPCRIDSFWGFFWQQALYRICSNSSFKIVSFWYEKKHLKTSEIILYIHFSNFIYRKSQNIVQLSLKILHCCSYSFTSYFFY